MKVPKNNNFLLKQIYFNINSPDGVDEEILISEIDTFETSLSMFKNYEIGKIEFSRQPSKIELMTEKLMSMNGSRLFVSFETSIEKSGIFNAVYYILKVKKTVGQKVKYQLFFTDFMGYMLNSVNSNKKYTGKNFKEILEEEMKINDLLGEVTPTNKPLTNKYFLNKKYRSKHFIKVGPLKTPDFVFHQNKNLLNEIERYFVKTGEVLMPGMHSAMVGLPSELFSKFKKIGPIYTFVKDAYYDSLNPNKYYGIRLLPPNSGKSMNNTPMVSQFKIDFKNKKVKSERYNMGDALVDDGNNIELKATSNHTPISTRKVLLPGQHKKIENEYKLNIINKDLVEIVTYGRVAMDIGVMVNLEAVTDINSNTPDPNPRNYECIVVGINNRIVDRYFLQTLVLSILKEK